MNKYAEKTMIAKEFMSTLSNQCSTLRHPKITYKEKSKYLTSKTFSKLSKKTTSAVPQMQNDFTELVNIFKY